MEKNPHQLIEGVIITSYACRVSTAFIYVRGELAFAASQLERAIDEAYAAGLIGKNILGSGYDLEVIMHRGAGAYICGEESALMESLEGRRGYPRLKPPFPAAVGLYGGPTVINNCETLSTVPAIVLNGADWYASIRHREEQGHARLLPERTRQAARAIMNCRWAHPCARSSMMRNTAAASWTTSSSKQSFLAAPRPLSSALIK